jgi:hypothetical protein
MVAEWVVGLMVALIAAPVAVASYVSARRAASAERQPPRPARVAHHAPARRAARPDEHRHYHRHRAA